MSQPSTSLNQPTPASNLTEGTKFDIGKERYDLLPVGPLNEWTKVLTMGATKYEDRNWEKGIKYGRCFAAMLRHAWKWWNGETYDPKDGQHHLASVIANAGFLLHYDLNKERYTDFDDRPESQYESFIKEMIS